MRKWRAGPRTFRGAWVVRGSVIDTWGCRGDAGDLGANTVPGKAKDSPFIVVGAGRSARIPNRGRVCPGSRFRGVPASCSLLHREGQA